jgi:tRNA(Ile)-lysidine synthase
MIAPKYYQRIKKHIQNNGWEHLRIVAAVSGGADSMALCLALLHLQIPFVIAHCNFHLRGDESNGDEAHVTQWAKDNNILCYVKHFDIQTMLEEQGGNLQELCRDVRYEWFETLRKELKYDRIAIAHHKEDSVETVLMNLMKGTGIAGLHGILPEQGKIIRPLLPLSKKDLIEILNANDTTWREDSSNKKDVYLRNKIRHHLLPLMEEILPQAIDGIYQTSNKIQDIEAITQPIFEKKIQKLLEHRGKDIYISILKLRNTEGYKTILFEALKPFHITAQQMNDVLQLLDAHTAKQVITSTHKIIKNRAFLIITEIQASQTDLIVIENAVAQTIDFEDGVLEITFNSNTKTEDSNHFNVNASKLTWPILLRKVKEGDYFYPKGMQMKKKKVSKLLKDEKIPIHEKSKIWVLESDKQIIGVLGMRMDERFVCKPTEQQSTIQFHFTAK